jgi:chromosome segregation ATPase
LTSTDSHSSGDKRSPIPVRQSKSKDMRSTKENRRLEDNAHKDKEAAKQQKAIESYVKKISDLKVNLQKKEDEFEELKLNHDELKQKYKRIEYENGRIRGVLQKVRDSPEEFASQLAKKGSGKRKKVGPTMDDASTKSGMTSLGKEAVKSVWRVYKFINTKAHEETFIESVLDHLGKEEFMYYNTDTDERKRDVLQKRLECIEDYGKGWVSELNVHRTYVQVSTN